MGARRCRATSGNRWSSTESSRSISSSGFKPTPEEQLKSYDVKEKKLATVLMISIIKGSISLQRKITAMVNKK